MWIDIAMKDGTTISIDVEHAYEGYGTERIYIDGAENDKGYRHQVILNRDNVEMINVVDEEEAAVYNELADIFDELFN